MTGVDDDARGHGERIAFLPETLAAYFDHGSASAHVLAETPRCVMDIEPRGRVLRLRMPALGGRADVSGFERLWFDETTELGTDQTYYELGIDADGIEFEAYSLIASIVDRLEQGDEVARAIDRVLRTYRDLLSGRPRLSTEQQLGLFGELEVFLHLVETLGERDAAQAWLGPDSEEHDFVLGGVDLEVKTTRSERREHVIGALGQLTATPGRGLYLVSLQYTSAGLAHSGETLPQRVARARDALGETLTAFDDKLRSLGWNDRDAFDVYPDRYLRRSAPRAYLVDDAFPAITDGDLSMLTRRPELIVSVSYRVDVTTLDHALAPSELAGLCEGIR